MANCFSTVVDGEYIDLIPVYVYSIRTWSNDDIVIFVRGKCPERILNRISGNVSIVQDYALEYPKEPSVTASIRFLLCEEYLKQYEYVMITDVDMLLLVCPWIWYTSRITETNPFCGHHGAWNLQSRPHICKAWRGSFERVTGGIFCVSKQWWGATRKQRVAQLNELKNSKVHYREEDEVLLCRVIKRSRLRVPPAGGFPHDYRGVHLGDFKFDHRWKNIDRMKNLLTDNVCKKYIEMRKSNRWNDVVSGIQNDSIKSMVRNLDTHISIRYSNG